MQWTDVTQAPSRRTLRQFAVLCLVLAGGAAAWRWRNGTGDATTVVLAVLGAGIGVLGLVAPGAIRPVFTGWMVAAFPIGWVVSRIAMGLLFYGMFTPVALVCRLMKRDVLQRRRQAKATYWTPKAGPSDAAEYFRQF
jgi:hypothetical protein